MLPTIVFVLALFVSIWLIIDIGETTLKKAEYAMWDLIMIIVACLLWGWLYWLSH